MSKKTVCLVSNFAITCLLCIFGILISVSAEDFLNKTLDAGEFTNWSIVLVMFFAFIIFLSIISLLCNFQSVTENKNSQFFFLMIDIVVIVVSTILFMVIINKVYSNGVKLLDSDNTAKEIEKLTMDLTSATTFKDCFLILLIASISNMILPICILTGRVNNENNDKKELDENDPNFEIKKEIESLKKQLELEDLKEEYVKLQKQLKSRKPEIKEKEEKN